jgi:hypothetical protein
MRKIRQAVAVAAAAAATLTLMAPASADRAAFREHRGDAPRHIDLTAALVDNGSADPDLVKMRIRVAGKLRIGDDVTVWFNRDPSDAGPELRLRGFVDSEFVLRRVHTWNGPGKAASCALYSMKQLADNTGVRVRINRSCLGNRPVRAAIRTHADGGAIDWFHGRRTWLTAVKH